MTAAADTGASVSTTRRNALTGRQLRLIVNAARKAMEDSDIDISPAKINKLARRFEKALRKARITFHEFLADETYRRRLAAAHPELAPVISYLDPTGETAVNRVMRQRGW